MNIGDIEKTLEALDDQPNFGSDDYQIHHSMDSLIESLSKKGIETDNIEVIEVLPNWVKDEKDESLIKCSRCGNVQNIRVQEDTGLKYTSYKNACYDENGIYSVCDVCEFVFDI